jgi:hypothetical protein
VSDEKELGRLPKSELIKIFSEEIKSAEGLIEEVTEKSMEFCILHAAHRILSSEMKAARRSGDLKRIVKLDGRLEALRKELKKSKEDLNLTLKKLGVATLNSSRLLEKISNLSCLVNNYKKRYEEMASKRMQEVKEDFLIEAITSIRKAIADIRACKIQQSKEGVLYGKLGSQPPSPSTKSYQLSISQKPRFFKYPWDWAGYDSKKYPWWIDIDPDKIRCKNCRHWNGHWDKKEQVCLISGRRTKPDYRCPKFSRRGL